MVGAALSPSRAGDFLSCPLLFRYRTIDRLPSSSSPDAVRGTLVHQVLEDIFDLPAPERTPAAAHALVDPAWEALRARSAQVRDVAATLDEPTWLASAHEVIDRWFVLEDPTRLEPAEREAWVEATLPSGLTLRGVIDRLDQAPDGSLRIVDYKTASAVREGFEQKALFQLRLYALVLWRSRGVVPSMLQLVYLGETSEMVRYEPDEQDLLATERKVDAIWAAIEESRRTGVFEPSPGRQCDWCDYKAHCPAFGGQVLPMPAPPTRWTRLRRDVRRRWRRLRRRLRGS
ncbi:PD-(D/E)XK nuclease family protein [Nocardioides anomalus]|uniref:PD-(D/E)XK nuclease family protein n=1 Tax=Nocardioides anomalus TaxID=2712223 RepID=A0A6G6WDG9_9ACTN|nr:PD-(D/E)XK nuclease family protein [Nocardioides anomalus]QIG43197.1 PD-(D/E)XK nuclease family protein [Nocardioides anomalus]